MLLRFIECSNWIDKNGAEAVDDVIDADRVVVVVDVQNVLDCDVSFLRYDIVEHPISFSDESMSMLIVIFIK